MFTLPKFTLPTFEVPKFEVPKFNVPFDLPKVDLPKVELPVEQVTGAVRNVAYAGAGLVALTTEKVTETVTDALATISARVAR